MLAKLLCHKFFQKSLTHLHKARTKTLLDCGDALIHGNKLTLTSIGRHLHGSAHVKHKIKRVDRFLKNKYLYQEQVDIYKAIIQPIIANLPYLAIAIDWSGCCTHKYHLLRASLLVDGRSITIFNMVVEQNDLESRDKHSLFLKQLNQIIGEHQRIYIVTDGGFLTPWYSEVISLGWHVVGRVRGTMKCYIEKKGQWKTLKELHVEASTTPATLGKARLTQHSPTACDAYLHLYHGEAKGRKGKSRFTKDTKMYQNLAKEPWVLSSTDEMLNSEQVVKIYMKRTQIEQNFRDDKSQRYGFSWRFSQSNTVERISILCLIAFVGSMALWFIGYEAESKKWHVKFQANTVKEHRVLSFLTLAKQVLKHMRRRITQNYIDKSLQNFNKNYLKYSVL